MLLFSSASMHKNDSSSPHPLAFNEGNPSGYTFNDNSRSSQSTSDNQSTTADQTTSTTDSGNYYTTPEAKEEMFA